MTTAAPLPLGFRLIPFDQLDPGFRRNIRELARIEKDEGRSRRWWFAVTDLPWITEQTFDPTTTIAHCPHAHEGPQAVEGHDSWDGQEYVRRRCGVEACRSTWLMPLDS